ncbi:M56 family metallopeptidase [Salinimicrobium flavum]|uniref:M56 family metallopeptidase n=1 Tax=Salinimicrobium flavum TaxID=1737065 RepID=A0ABW5IYJ6_9FLAO
MQELIIYLLKSAGLISLFYAGYYFLLKDDTNFKTNRIFLLAGIITSLLLPSLEITRTVIVDTASVPIFFENASATSISTVPAEAAGTDWWQIAGMIYLIGFSFFLLKFLLELFFLLKLIFKHKSFRKSDHYLIHKPGITQPFSFFKHIVLDPDQHSPAELEIILKHEHSHVRQWHSVDQLLSSFSVYLLWFNPWSWLYRKSLVQNLEYLADKEVILEEVSKKEYQKTLLKISLGDYRPALTNQFYQSFIKKRIMMLNKNTTQKSSFWKTGLLLPFLFFFILSFNVKTEAQEVISGSNPKISKMEVSAYVTKDSEEKELRALENLFGKQGVELKFDDLEFSEGLLTNVAVSFRKKSTGTTGNLSLNNSNGISPLLIYTDGEKVVMTPKTAVPEKSEGALSGLGNSPLYIIAGKEYKTSQLTDKYIETKGTWSVIKPKEALEEFGSKAKDGAIIISESNIIDDFKEALKHMDLKQLSFNQRYIQVKKNAPPVLLRIETKVNQNSTPAPSSFKSQKIQFHSDPDEIIAFQTGNKKDQKYYFRQMNTVVILDGEVMEKDFDVNTIEPSTIKSLNILKDADAVEKYGEGAKNGVIKIELKSEEEIKATSELSEEKSKPLNIRVSNVQFDNSKEKRSARLSVRDVGSADPDALTGFTWSTEK